MNAFSYLFAHAWGIKIATTTNNMDCALTIKTTRDSSATLSLKEDSSHRLASKKHSTKDKDTTFSTYNQNCDLIDLETMTLGRPLQDQQQLVNYDHPSFCHYNTPSRSLIAASEQRPLLPEEYLQVTTTIRFAPCQTLECVLVNCNEYRLVWPMVRVPKSIWLNSRALKTYLITEIANWLSLKDATQKYPLLKILMGRIPLLWWDYRVLRRKNFIVVQVFKPRQSKVRKP